MMERVMLLLLLLLALLFSYMSVGRGGKLIVGKQQGHCNIEEREALISFKKSLNDPHLLLSNWDIGNDCCGWKGVGCSNITNKIIGLDFIWSIGNFTYMEGPFFAMSLNPSLFRLQHLQFLRLTGIFFNRTIIPQTIDSLTNLRYLDLSYSGFIGVIPPHIGNLTNLRFLDLMGNNLSASNLLWVSHLSSLEFLDMTFVNLTLATNWLQEIMMLPALSMLRLSVCRLQTLPMLLPYYNFSSNLKIFDVSKNNFQNSMIPYWLSNMTKLLELYLDNCQLQGMIHSNIMGAIYTLRVLSLSNNLITGIIPQSIGNMSNLIYLRLGYNQIGGHIPESIGQLMNLKYLDLGANQLQGSFSEINFVNLSQIELLDLSHNHLEFNINSFNWIPTFQLSFLSLSYCKIGPHFPLWLKTQKFLSMLELSNCGISDIIPTWFWNISRSFDYLNMSHNAIRGELDMPMNIASKEAILDLRSNLFEGHLPQLMGLVSYVFFSNNKFSKGIELYLNANMSSLKVLDLSHNRLFNELPDSICQMNSLIMVDLSHNNLFGEIPKCMGINSSLIELKFISLSYNNFWGSIPQWIGSLSKLVSLHLNNNNFQGGIPFFKKYSKLITLDLGQNKLTGNIPLWIGNRLSSLKILSLRSNSFHGSIPFEIFKLEGLHILDLADNSLSGPLPKSLKFLKAMAIQNRSLEGFFPIPHDVPRYMEVEFLFYKYVQMLSNIILPDSIMIDLNGMGLEYDNTISLVMTMDLSCNNLTGEIPSELMSLVGLISLNLSRNQFNGQIPINIGFMQSLESLDLSMNYLSGEIPHSIANLSGLSHLNLSYNQLSGRIPVGTQLQSFDESSYYGNPKLCGKPLINTCEGDEHNIHNGGYNSRGDGHNYDFFLGMSLGFIVGLWGVLGTLLLKRSWAIAYFQWYKNITNSIHVFVLVKVNRWFNQ